MPSTSTAGGQSGKMNVTGKFWAEKQISEKPSQPSTVRLNDVSVRDNKMAIVANAEYQMPGGQMERVPVYSKQNNDDVFIRATNYN